MQDAGCVARHNSGHGQDRDDLPQPALQHVPQYLEGSPGAGLEPTVVKYLETPPPSRDGLRKLLDDAGLKPSEAIRRKEALFAELNLADASEDELIDAMVENPILIERPIVVTDKGTVLARPVDKVREIL